MLSWGLVGSTVRHWAVGRVEIFLESLNNLRSTILVGLGVVATFFACDTSKVCAVLSVGDEDFHFRKVVEGGRGVLDERTELEIVNKELVVL